MVNKLSTLQSKSFNKILYLAFVLLLLTNVIYADNKQIPTIKLPHRSAAHQLATVNHLQTVEDYLNSFRTLKARFKQINPNGTLAFGTLYLWRPGRMRLSYDQPNVHNPLLQRIIVADGDSFFDHNPEMDETTEIPVDATPASFIMRDHIYFGHDIKVVNNQIHQGMLAITLAKRDDQDVGTLTLFFNLTPLKLLEWEIVDSQQLRTRVILDVVETGIKLDAKLFNTNF